MPVTIERPAIFTKKIAELLSTGTVEDACGPEGRMLQELMTADEKYLIMELPFRAESPPGFDGTTCDMCRGRCRFTNCTECRGYAANLGAGRNG